MTVGAEVISKGTAPSIIADITFDHIEKDKVYILPWAGSEKKKCEKAIAGRIEDILSGANPDLKKNELREDLMEEIRKRQAGS